MSSRVHANVVKTHRPAESTAAVASEELAAGFAEELLEAGADEVFVISGATGAGIEQLLDKVLQYLPDRTATETNAAEVEDEEEGGGEWSPI